ncbi:hypothetical protein ACWCKR_002082 [Yersinia enterocolitica]|uniref:hypothetical protein n=1 Tax=Yersinia enterocolitica TaxID=630 RepID=UPI00330E9321|nr:hypothetical protein [Yersinia enterocolitica]
MNLVVDANVFKGFYQETVLEMGPDKLEITGSPIGIFESDDKKIYVDDSKHIENEWRNVVDSEWFNAWYAVQIESLGIVETAIDNYQELIRALNKIGFPVGGDKWYIRTAKSVKENGLSITLITEDLDFYDPTKKMAKGAARLRILNSKSAVVRKYLAKKEDINISCVKEFLP